jgi:hypothetical protein
VATTVVSLLFIVVLAGDLLLPSVGGLASAPAPMQQREAAPQFALEAAPTDDGEADLVSPSPAPEEPAREELKEEPEVVLEKEEAVTDVTEPPQAPAGAGGGTPSAMEEVAPTEEVAALAVPTGAPTVTAVTDLTPTIPAEAPVVSEDELGLLEPTPSELEGAPRLIQEERDLDRLSLPSAIWRVLEVVLGLASLMLILATFRAWRLRHR